MRTLISFAVLTAAVAFAQQQTPKKEAVDKTAAAAKAAVEGPAAAGQPARVTVGAEGGSKEIPLASLSSILTMPPEQAVATIDGVKVSAGDLQTILRALPPQQQQQALANRVAFLKQFGVMRRLAADAEKAKLDTQSPWKEQLANMRMQMLANAAINQKFTDIQVTPEQTKAHFEKNKDGYTQAKVKAIYLPFSTDPVSKPDAKGSPVMTEDEAKAKAEDIVKQIRAGGDFVKLVKQYSGDPTSAAKDGDFGTIKKADRIPDAVKTAIFAAKAGEVTAPVRQANGFYIFRIEEIGAPPIAQVQENITNELKGAEFQRWMNQMQDSVTVQEESIKMEMEVIKPAEGAPSSPTPAPAAPKK